MIISLRFDNSKKSHVEKGKGGRIKLIRYDLIHRVNNFGKRELDAHFWKTFHDGANSCFISKIMRSEISK